MLCVDHLPSDPVPAGGKYQLTPGTLNGVLASAQAVIAARGATDACGLTANRLAAFMLSVGYREIPLASLVAPARSPLTPGRRDSHTNMDLRVAKRMENRLLYSNDRPYSGPPRALYHIGVGLWQIDDFSSWGYLNQGERTNVGTGHQDGSHRDSGGAQIAARFAEEYCGDPGGNTAVRNFLSGGTWGACNSGKCYSEQFDQIYLDRTDDLFVTTSRNEGEYSASGGASRHNCRWSDERSESSIECWFIDASNPEGDIYIPAVLYGDSLDTSTDGLSPLAAPFLALTFEAKAICGISGVDSVVVAKGPGRLIGIRWASPPARVRLIIGGCSYVCQLLAAVCARCRW